MQAITFSNVLNTFDKQVYKNKVKKLRTIKTDWLMLFFPLLVLFYSFILTEGKSEWCTILTLIHKNHDTLTLTYSRKAAHPMLSVCMNVEGRGLVWTFLQYIVWTSWCTKSAPS